MYEDMHIEGLRFKIRDIPWDPLMFSDEECEPKCFDVESSKLVFLGSEGLEELECIRERSNKDYPKKVRRTCMKKISAMIRSRCKPILKPLKTTLLTYLCDSRPMSEISSEEMFGHLLVAMLMDRIF